MSAAQERVAAGLQMGRRLKSLYASGVVRGTFLIEIPSPRVVRALALAGLDFVVVDLEHSPFGVDQVSVLLAEGQACDLPMIVRVGSIDPALIGKVLDMGANGVMVPRVSDENEARAAVRACRYAPLGDRGLCPLISFSALAEPQTTVDRDVVVIVQIEGRAGLDNCGPISRVPGVDGVFVGPYDLSQSLGVPSDVDNPLVTQAADEIARDLPAEVMLGVYVDEASQSGGWAARGFRLQCVSFDARILLNGARQMLATANPA